MPGINETLVSADSEWSKLRSVIAGRAENSCFPSKPAHMIAATMPKEHQDKFRPYHPFDSKILANANEELENLVSILQREGNSKVMAAGAQRRKDSDGLLTVGNHIIEAPFAWKCRRQEISLAFSSILEELARDPSVRVIRAPVVPKPDPIYDGMACKLQQSDSRSWAVNNSRPSFDAADSTRVDKSLLGQFSNVTNEKGVR